MTRESGARLRPRHARGRAPGKAPSLWYRYCGLAVVVSAGAEHDLVPARHRGARAALAAADRPGRRRPLGALLLLQLLLLLSLRLHLEQRRLALGGAEGRLALAAPAAERVEQLGG